MKESINTTICSIPVESAGEILNRKRSEGAVGIFPKVAIVNLIEAMKNDGFASSSYDFYDIDMLYPSDADIQRYFSTKKPDVIGLSAVLSMSYSQVKRISSIIRETLSESWIVMGGNLAASAETVLKHTEVDLCIVGDGELSWVKVLNHILRYPERKKFKTIMCLLDIKGVAFLDQNNEINMNGFGVPVKGEEIIYPDYELLKSGLKECEGALANYFRPGFKSGLFDFDKRASSKCRGRNVANIFTTKGCVSRCTFCQRSIKGYRTMSLKRLEEHLVYLRENFDVGFIKILDENFGSNKRHAYEVSEILNKHEMLWIAQGRCASFTDEDLRFYKSRGCSAIKFGVETGSQKMLDVMEKRTKVKDIYNALTTCHKYKVFSPMAILLGMPGEDESTARETGKLIGKVAAKIGVHPKILEIEIFYPIPIPGSPLWEYGERLGVISTECNEVDKLMMQLSKTSAYKRYYLNLNGANICEVLFWEYIVQFEASRVFRNERKKASNNMEKAYKKSYFKQISNNPRASLKYTSLKFTAISYFIDKFVVGNYIVDILPRRITYPIFKCLIFVEHQIQKSFRYNRGYQIFKKSKKIERFHNASNESLRKHLNKHKISLQEMSSVEKVRDILRKGQ